MFDQRDSLGVYQKIAAAMEAIAGDRDLRITLTSTEAGDVNALRFVVDVESGCDDAAATAAARYFKECATRCGLSPDDLGRTFDYFSLKYVITGAESYGDKTMILCRRAGGRVGARSRFLPGQLHRAFAREQTRDAG